MNPFTSLMTADLVGAASAASATAASTILGGHVSPPTEQGPTRAVELDLIVIGPCSIITIDDEAVARMGRMPAT